MIVITANMGDQAGNATEKLRNSCSFYGLKLLEVGKEDPWVSFMASKLKAIHDALYEIKDKYVLYTDGWDAWMLADSKTIMRKYKSFKKDKDLLY